MLKRGHFSSRFAVLSCLFFYVQQFYVPSDKLHYVRFFTTPVAEDLAFCLFFCLSHGYFM